MSTSVVDRLRRRLRSNGYRAHLTLQMVPTEGEEHLLSRVHLTPVRASRSLALRFLANKFGLPMQNVTVRLIHSPLFLCIINCASVKHLSMKLLVSPRPTSLACPCTTSRYATA